MAIHVCRDLVVGSTGSYSNLYAISCFLEGVMGFTRVGSSGRAEWQNNLLPITLQQGSAAGGATLSGSGGVGILTVSGSVGGWAKPPNPAGGVDFLLAIRSETYPLVNSGLYRIVGCGANTISFDLRAATSASLPLSDPDFTFKVFPPVESVFNDLDVAFNCDPDLDGDIDINGWDNNPQMQKHVDSGSPTVQSRPIADSPQIGNTGAPNFFPIYSYTNDEQLNLLVDSSTGWDRVDDYVTFAGNKAYFYFIWNPFQAYGLLPYQTFPPAYTASSQTARTLVASLVDRPANLWGAPNDGLYHTQGSSYMLRVIYQSPHPSGWQVRLAMESSYDVGDAAAGGACRGVTLSISPGYSGSNGDFAVRGPHLHGPQWYNTASSSYRGTVVGLNPVNASSDYAPGHSNIGNQFADKGLYTFSSFNAGAFFPADNPNPASTQDIRWRMFIWGDDETGSIVVANRNYYNATNEFVAFGLPEDEPMPLPAHNVQRLFAIGQNGVGQGVDWRCGTHNEDGITGVAYSLDLRRGPVSCTTAPYVYLTDVGVNGSHQRFDAAAGDSPFTGVSELLPVDLVAGTRMSMNIVNDVDVLPLEPRRMGRFPIARMGRSTGQSSWAAVGPNKDWFHTTNGFYLPWGGMTPLA